MPSTTESKKTKTSTKSAHDEDKTRAKRAKRSTKKRAEEDDVESPDDDVENEDEESDDEERAPASSKRRAKKTKTKARDDASDDDQAGEPDADTDDEKPASKAKSRASKNAPKTDGKSSEPIDLSNAVLQALATNERMNQFLLEHLDDRAWTASPPIGRGRTIAAIVAHMHNVRHMWLVVAAKGEEAPDKLDRKSVKKPQAMHSLAASHAAMLALFERSLENGGRVKDFKPDVVGFLGYVIAHEAHHRGQICMLARELGFGLSQDVNFGLWDWKKRWQECET